MSPPHAPPDVEERNRFYDALPPEAKERFLETLEKAAAAGIAEEEAWAQAADAARSAYRSNA